MKIRVDDFPPGDKKRYIKDDKGWKMSHPEDKKNLKEFLSIFELYKIPYILGVSPLLLRDGDIDFLNENIKFGEICMHGFDHGFNQFDWQPSFKAWHPIWYAGGEFRNMTENQIEENYEICKGILSNVDKYNQNHFTVPFDIYTQELINVLSKKDIKKLHTCRSVYEGFRLSRFECPIELIIAEPNYYDFIPTIVERLKKGQINVGGQIYLHWIFDTTQLKEDWRPSYHEFCKIIKDQI